MDVIELGSPRIRSRAKSINKFIYQTRGQIFLPPPSRIPSVQFFKTIIKRRSRRAFAELSIHELANILWFTCKSWEVSGEGGKPWEHRCVPSAGGIHPIDILISIPKQRRSGLFLYDPISHSLKILSGISGGNLKKLIQHTNEILPIEQGAVLWFAAQFEKTLYKYAEGESLVWRDSGALMGAIYFVAEALNLNCCALGATGDPFVSRIFGGTKKLKGVGGCVLGARL